MSDNARLTSLPVADNCLPVAEVAIITYIGPSGERLYGWGTRGDGTVQEIIGLLETVKHALLHGEADT